MNVRRLSLRRAFIALLVTSAFAAAAHAQAERGKPGWGYALADELMSPWCPGFALPDCSSGYAQDLRFWILEQEKLGRSRADVKAEILARYGEKMLQAPSAKGRGALAYAIPAAIILAGLAVLVTFLRNQAASARASGTENLRANASEILAKPDEHLMSRVDAEIAHFESTHD